MSAAKSRLEVVQRNLICQVYEAESKAELSAVSAQKIVMPRAQVVDIAALHASWIVVVIFCSWLRNADQGAVAFARVSLKSYRCLFTVAQSHGIFATPYAGCYQPGIIAPGEGHPGAALVLVAQVGVLLKFLIVVNAKDVSSLNRRRKQQTTG